MFFGKKFIFGLRVKNRHEMVKENGGGDERIRTADGGFADPCLATWLRRHNRIKAQIAYSVQA